MATRPSRRTPYHHGDLPRALLRVAERMVRDEGADALSLRAVARRAGVDPAAVYRHFDDKDALLRTVAGRGFAALATAMQAGLDQARTPADRLAAVGAAYVRFAAREPALFRLMFGGRTREVTQASEVGASQPSPYELLIEALGALGVSSDQAIVAWSAVHGLATLAIDGRVDDLDAALPCVLGATVRGLRRGGSTT